MIKIQWEAELKMTHFQRGLHLHYLTAKAFCNETKTKDMSATFLCIYLIQCCR